MIDGGKASYRKGLALAAARAATLQSPGFGAEEKHQQGQLLPSAPVAVEVGMELQGLSITLEMEIHLESSLQAWCNSPCSLQVPSSKSVSSEKLRPPKIPVQQRAAVKGPTS